MTQTVRETPPPPAPVAREATRLRRPSYRDPRLVAGVLLVAGSVVAGTRAVQSFDASTPHYTAARALVPGERLKAADLRVVDVNLGATDSLYLKSAVPADGLLVTRGVGEGGLVPVDSVATGGDVGQQPVTLNVQSAGVSGLNPGDLVDVWVAGVDPDKSSRFLKPSLLVRSAQLRSVGRGGSALTVSGNDAAVSVVVPQARVADLLDASANGARISLVAAGSR